MASKARKKEALRALEALGPKVTLLTRITVGPEWTLNTRPRKTLGWKAPAELFLPPGAFDFVKFWQTTPNLVALAP
jgi:hypothetical protein